MRPAPMLEEQMRSVLYRVGADPEILAKAQEQIGFEPIKAAENAVDNVLSESGVAREDI